MLYIVICKCNKTFIWIFKIHIFMNKTPFRLFYAGALKGQMPKILSMIQVSRMTPTPAFIVLVSFFFIFFCII